ncbi:TRAP transporter large permease [Chloroflexota bacterium]
MVTIDPFTLGIIGIIVMFILLSLGMHIGIVLALIGATGTAILVGFHGASVSLAANFYHLVSKYVFSVVPMFVLMGILASEAGVGRKIYDTLSYWTGRLRAGLGIATVLACAFFGSICGSSMITSAVFAKVAAPEMRRHGYSKSLAYGLCASAGAIGMLIPPSILIVLYAILTEESVGRLLVAGISPGLLLTIIFSTGLIVWSRIDRNLIKSTETVAATWKQRFASLKDFWPVFTVGIITFGGIFGGIFTPTEAGAVACAAMVVLVFLIIRRGFKGIVAESLRETAKVTAMSFLILCGANMFAKFMGLSGVSQAALASILEIDMTPVQFIVVMCFVYLIMGCFFDALSMFAITIPIVYPTVTALGIDPVWYAMSVILAVHIGLITPPVGMDVYGVKGVAPPDVTLEDCFRGVIPFVLMMSMALAIIIAFPKVSTILPDLMFKPI